MTRALLALLARDLRLALRAGGGAELGLLFALSLVAVVPFALGPDQALLARLAPALLWIAALLATLVGLDRLFRDDEEEGALDLLLTGEAPPALAVLVKALAHWLAGGLPLSLALPAVGLLLAIEPASAGPLLLSLLLGTPALALIGALGAAVTVGLRRGALLLPVLVLPLAAPVLIFGVAAAGGSEPALRALLALLLASAALAPPAAALALRLARD